MMKEGVYVDNTELLKYLIMGGDERIAELAEIFVQKKYIVSSYGIKKSVISKAIREYENIDKAIEDNDIIIGPIPFAVRENILNSKYFEVPIAIDCLLGKIAKNKILFGGAFNKNTKDIIKNYDIKYFDYNEDESFQIFNAIATAEGTIGIVINETNKTIFNSNILILGYGRIGKILSKYLKALGANTFVEARKDSDLTWIYTDKLVPIYIEDLKLNIDKMDIIINTIPSLIINKQIANEINKNALVIDLASKPGGIDFEYCKARGIKTIQALGIPGKTAYKSAANYIFDTIIKTLNHI